MMLVYKKSWIVKLEFKIQDCWIGVFWKFTSTWQDVWICIIPCFPIHFYRNKQSVI